MTKTEARKWIKAFKNAKFKCMMPDQVLEAMRILYGTEIKTRE